MRIAVGLEYDGTAFNGWQSQPDGAAVQDALERALCAISGEPTRVTAAGRTDAGVHASLQIAHFDTEVERPLTAWIRGVNAHLPDSIAILWAEPTAPEFHARFSAMSRHYTYLLMNRAVRPGLFAHQVGWCHRPLDLGAMHEAARALIGTHDFSAFRAAECQAKTPVKTVMQADVRRIGDLVCFEFCANAYLHHMIRNIIGSLVHVGAGKAPMAWLADLLESRDRTRAAATFAPQGLYFTGADYPAHFGLDNTRRVPALVAAGAMQ